MLGFEIKSGSIRGAELGEQVKKLQAEAREQEERNVRTKTDLEGELGRLRGTVAECEKRVQVANEELKRQAQSDAQKLE